LERSDTLINLRNQEIAALNSRLAAKEETIAEAAEQFDRLDQEVTQLRSQLATERADREEIEGELFALKQKSAPPARELDKAHLLDLLNQFLKKYPKSNFTSVQMKVLLEMIKKSCDDTSQEN
jgi:chromosome segregation ATPase